MYDFQKIINATRLDEAIAALVENPDAMIISGGTDVLVQLREGRHLGLPLVSIHEIPELHGVRMEADGTILIGAATSFSKVTYNPIVAEHLPVLAFAADQVGGPQIRNMGTIGGNVCNGVTSADTATTLCALNAILVLEGPDGEREVPISEWYVGVGKTVRAQNEILKTVKITPENYVGFGGHYIKYAQRNAMDIATLGCSVNLRLSQDKKVMEDVRIAFGVAAPVPSRCAKAEAAITGMAVGEEMFATLRKIILEDVNPRDSWRASKAFRVQLVKELSKRAVKESILKAGGEIHA